MVVITGGSRGLGLAMAREFARNGAVFALLARDGGELQRAAADVLRFETEVSTWPCDLRKEGCRSSHGALLREQVRASGLFRRALRASRSAGRSRDNGFAWPDAHGIVNVFAMFRLCMAILPTMRKGGSAQPAELAPLFVFLASDQASYVTGEVYGATGGQMPV